MARVKKMQPQLAEDASMSTSRAFESSVRREATERKPREERWQELLNAAAKIFYEKGYEASSLQDIANEVGILKGSIYYYIKTKKDLRDHLVNEVHLNGIRLVKSAAMTKGNPLERLEAVIIAHVTYLCNNMAQTAVYLEQFKNVIADSRYDMKRHAYRDVVESVIREGQEEGYIFEDMHPSFTAQVILSSLNSVSQWYTPRKSRPPKMTAEHLARVLVRGHATAKGLRFLARRDNANADADA